LQTGFTALCAEANVAQKRAQAPPPEAGDHDRVVRFEHTRPGPSRDD
ncbi:MAG: hypothetical protein JWR30_653, partial [Conexibacter sp.]|nr:hypothetical protein [Conexibacter sp.]